MVNFTFLFFFSLLYMALIHREYVTISSSSTLPSPLLQSGELVCHGAAWPPQPDKDNSFRPPT